MERGWSINSADWAELQAAVPSSRSWHSVLLTRAEGLMVPPRPGVYAICVPPPNATDGGADTVFKHLSTPLYIGRSTSSIKARFLDHCKTHDPDLREAKRCYSRVQLRFWFTELSAGEVPNAERCLIKCFWPPVNKIAGSTIKGTLKPAQDP